MANNANITLKTSYDKKLRELRDQLYTKTDSFYSNLSQGYKDSFVKLWGTDENLKNKLNPIIEPLLADLKNFQDSQFERYQDIIAGAKDSIKKHDTGQRRAMYEMQKDFHRDEKNQLKQKINKIEAAQQQIESLKFDYTTITDENAKKLQQQKDEAKKRDALNLLENQKNKLWQQAKEFYKTQDKIMSNIVGLAHRREVSEKRYQELYGHKPEENLSIAEFYKKATVIKTKQSWLENKVYGHVTIEQGGTIYNNPYVKKHQIIAIEQATHNWYAQHANDPDVRDKTPEITITMPNNNAGYEYLDIFGLAEQAMKENLYEAAKRGVKATVIRPNGEIYQPNAKFQTTINTLIAEYRQMQKESVAHYVKLQEKDLKNPELEKEPLGKKHRL